MNPGRMALYGKAESLARISDGSFDHPPMRRGRRLLQALEGVDFEFEDIVEAPSWAHLSSGERKRLALFAGAAAAASLWRRSLDGATLRCAASLIGEAALDALLAEAECVAPSPTCGLGQWADRDELERLGGGMMLLDLADRPGLQTWMRKGLPATIPHSDPVEARRCMAAAWRHTGYEAARQ